MAGYGVQSRTGRAQTRCSRILPCSAAPDRGLADARRVERHGRGDGRTAGLAPDGHAGARFRRGPSDATLRSRCAVRGDAVGNLAEEAAIDATRRWVAGVVVGLDL